MEQTLMIFLLALCGLACLLGFLTAGFDKRAAQARRRRTPERFFVLLSLFGGGFGVLAGFFFFRHKTKHPGLIAKVVMAALAAYAAVGFCLYLLLIQ